MLLAGQRSLQLSHSPDTPGLAFLCLVRHERPPGRWPSLRLIVADEQPRKVWSTEGYTLSSRMAVVVVGREEYQGQNRVKRDSAAESELKSLC